MIESKDPAIKLFGQNIPCSGEAEALTITGNQTASPTITDVEQGERDFNESTNKDEEKDKEHGAEKDTLKKKETDPPPNNGETKNNNSATTLAKDIHTPKRLSIDEETSISENDQTDAATTNHNSQEKILKKPDKILSCPRCNSIDTKFCYYNNYNVNQPRYFCKACQRYWTAGGTMRNVPVGAGRRKNKNNSSSHYRHITISEALQAARIVAPNGTHHLSNLKTNGRVLSFGLDHTQICDSMENVFHPASEKGLNSTRNCEFHSIEGTKILVSRSQNDGHNSIASSETVANSTEESGKTMSQDSLPQKNNGFIPQVPCITSVPWPYPWSSTIPSPPALCPPGFPMSFYPAAFWNVPWFPSHPSVTNLMSLNSSPNSPTLGKHLRDDDNDDNLAKQDHLQNEEPPKQRNGSVLVPKTLRIDDPSEAAKSSIWATLGITNECVSGGGMTKAFQSKKDGKKHVAETSPMLRANPAALARSLNFHESS